MGAPSKSAGDQMEIKVNMECAMKIMEKNGFNVEGRAAEGETLSASKETEGGDTEKIKPFQVHCNPPYIKFEAHLDDEAQRKLLEGLNMSLKGFIEMARKKEEQQK